MYRCIGPGLIYTVLLQFLYLITSEIKFIKERTVAVGQDMLTRRDLKTDWQIVKYHYNFVIKL